MMRDMLRGTVRLYTMYSPLHRGKDRLRTTLAPWIRPRASAIATSVPYGQRLRVLTDEYVSDQIYCYGCFERELVTMLAEALEPGMVFLDIGVHVGLYTVIAASRACRRVADLGARRFESRESSGAIQRRDFVTRDP